jgi:hypothetical protein
MKPSSLLRLNLTLSSPLMPHGITGMERVNLNYIYILIPYRAVNTLRLGYKIQSIMYRKIIAVCSETHTKHINELCDQNFEFFNAQAGGI